MRALFVTYENPFDGFAGDSIGTKNFIYCMQETNVKLDFLSFSRINSKNNFLKKYFEKIYLVPFKNKSKFKLAFSKYPALISNRKRNHFINSFKEILLKENYDFIIVNHFKMTYLIEHIYENNIKTIYISHNVETEVSKTIYKYSTNILKKIIYYQDYLKTKHYEFKYLKKFNVITAVSDSDLSFFKIYFKESDSYLIPPFFMNNSISSFRQIKEKKVILCGSFYWEPKKQNLLRLLNSKNFNLLSENNIVLLVVGNAPSKLVSEINKNYKNVYMTGLVDSTQKFYDESQVALVPELIGGGFKLKIAESISNNIPLIAFNESISDKDMQNDTHCICVNTFEDMILETVKLINDPVKQKYLAKNASELFHSKYSKESIENKLKIIFS